MHGKAVRISQTAQMEDPNVGGYKVADESLYLMNAQDEADRYMQLVDAAVASVDPGEMRQHVQEALGSGQLLMDYLEDALRTTEDPDMADRVESAMHQIGMSMDQGEQSLEIPDEEVEDSVSEMRRYSEQAMMLIAQTV